MSNVAMSVLGTSDGRSLSLLRVGSQDFRRLEAYFKKLRVKTKIGSKWSAVKTVHGLEERGGDYTFLRDGEEISIRVSHHLFPRNELREQDVLTNVLS